MKKIAAILNRHWTILLVFNSLVLAASFGAFSLLKPFWIAKAQLILPETGKLQASLGTLGSLTKGDSKLATKSHPLNMQASILNSDALMSRLLESDPEKTDFKRLVQYKKLFAVSPDEESTTIWLNATGDSPKLARDRVKALISAYQERLNELRQADGTTRVEFNKKALERAKQKLDQSQEALAKFQESSGLVNSKAQTEGLVRAITDLSISQAQAQAQAQASQHQLQILSTRLGLTPKQAIRSLGLAENRDYQFVRQQLTELEATLVKAQTTYTYAHPEIQNLLLQREQLQQQIQQYIFLAAGDTLVDPTLTDSAQGRAMLIQQLILAESAASGQQQQAEQLQQQIDQIKSTLTVIPVHQSRLLELKRQYNVAAGVYNGLVAQMEQVNLDAFSAYPNVQVLDPPTVDEKPAGPKKLLIIANGFLASAVGSIALVLLLERRNPLLSPKDLKAIKFPMVVNIPHLRHAGMGLELGTETDVEFQRLASVISLRSGEDRRILITSAMVSEGKTTVTLGLARALVDLGFRVLVVDGDFRQATLSQRLGHHHDPLKPGQPVKIQPSLDLLPTSHKKGKIVELVTQGKFEQSLATAEESGDYDYVLIDSAPVSMTSETALMAAVIGNLLFVVRPEISKRDFVSDSLEQLAQHNAQLLGLVVNGVETKSKPYLYRSSDTLVKS